MLCSRVTPPLYVPASGLAVKLFIEYAGGGGQINVDVFFFLFFFVPFEKIALPLHFDIVFGAFFVTAIVLFLRGSRAVSAKYACFSEIFGRRPLAHESS